MQSAVDQISPVLVEVTVEVPWDKVNTSLDNAYKAVQRQARVRGFRPGKVPRGVVKQLMGKSVEAEVTQNLIQEAIGNAVDEHSLEPLAMPEVDTPSIEQGQPLKFKAKLEIRPKIESVNTGGLEVERKLESVTDADVDKEIERMREQNAELAPPDPPRPAQSGDTATIDIEVEVEGDPREDLSSADARAELGVGGLLPEIEEALIGASVGDEKAAELTFPEDYGHEGLRGKHASFKLRVKELQEKQLPELDDEFAKDLEHESLEALRKDVRERLEATAERRTEALVREQVIEKLIDNNPLEVPPSLVERQKRAMLGEFMQFSQMMGQQMPFDEEMFAEIGTRAERKVRAGLLFGAIADEQKLEVSDEDIDAKLAEIAEQTGKHIAKVRAEYQGEQRDQLRTQLLESKLLEYLLSQATITDVEADAGDAQAGAETEAAEKKPAKKKAAKKKAAKKKPTKKKATKKKADEADDPA
ncbi:MAG: trigger factor [Myxococcales bacterium]|jgi:trigger factor